MKPYRNMPPFVQWGIRGVRSVNGIRGTYSAHGVHRNLVSVLGFVFLFGHLHPSSQSTRTLARRLRVLECHISNSMRRCFGIECEIGCGCSRRIRCGNILQTSHKRIHRLGHGCIRCASHGCIRAIGGNIPVMPEQLSAAFAE